MTTREDAIEEYLAKRVREIGGRAYKWVSPGNVGVPDRIVLYGRGRVCFVECKTARGKLSPVQKAKIDELTDLGHKTRIVASKEDVEELVQWLSISS